MGKVEEKKLERMGYVIKHDEEHDRTLIYEKGNQSLIGLLFSKEVFMPVYTVRAEVPLADVFVTNALKRWLSSFEGVSLDVWPYAAQQMHEPYQLVIKTKTDKQSMKTASEIRKQFTLQYTKELTEDAEGGVKRLEQQLLGKLMLDSMKNGRNKFGINRPPNTWIE